MTPPQPPTPRPYSLRSILATGARRVSGWVIPDLLAWIRADKKLTLPSRHNVPALVNAQMTILRNDPRWAAAHQDAVSQAVEHEAQRLAGLDSKGVATAAYSTAVLAAAAVLFGHNLASTVFASIGIVYTLCSLVTSIRLVIPSARATFTVNDALEPDWLLRMAAAVQVNKQVALSVQNRAYAAMADTVRAILPTLIAALLLFS